MLILHVELCVLFFLNWSFWHEDRCALILFETGPQIFELQNFEQAKKEFRIAARDDDKKIKKTANSWIKYTENEEIRVKNIALRRDYIQNQG